VALNACSINSKRILTGHEKQLIEKMDHMYATYKLLSQASSNSLEDLSNAGLVNNASKHILSMLPDMHIYENNIEAYE